MVSWTCLDMACGDTDRSGAAWQTALPSLRYCLVFNCLCTLEISCWAWIKKKKKKNLRPNKGIIWRGCASLPPYTTSLKPWTCIERDQVLESKAVSQVSIWTLHITTWYSSSTRNWPHFSLESVCLSAVSILPASLVILWALAKECIFLS